MIKGGLKENLVAELNSESHSFLSGLPEIKGGNDEGPDPHEYIEAGLAACTILTCQLYANRKQWPLESTEVEVKITSETKEGAVFKRTVRFKGELTDEQRERLLEIANKCPIHNLLTRPITVETSQE